jgi:hypothetical protein
METPHSRTITRCVAQFISEIFSHVEMFRISKTNRNDFGVLSFSFSLFCYV